jgi:hypothetical protein
MILDWPNVKQRLMSNREWQRKPLTALLIGLPARTIARTACAHGEIVYSARYYLLPDSKRHSYYRIYRIVSTGGSLSASPDRSKVCASVFFGPMPYQRRPNGEWRTVWTSYLAVIDHKTFKLHYIQSGIISCESVDWRHGVDDDPW